MRINREIAAVLALLLIFVVGGLLLGGPGDAHSRLVGQQGADDPSIYNDRALGSKGCFDWVGKLGYRPLAWRRNWSALGQSGASVLLIVDPQVPNRLLTLTGDDDSSDDTARDPSVLTADDAPVLRDWLKAGHTAILLSSRLPSAHGGEDETFGDALGITAETALVGGRTQFGPLQPVPETRNIISIDSASDARLSRPAPDALALFGDKSGSLVLSVPVGKGRLVAIADSEFVSNRSLPRAENAVLMAQLLALSSAPGGTVLFDEYHHGDMQLETGATIWTALGRPLQRALIQIGLALALVAAVVAVRFGLPVPLGRGRSRQSTEYVTSLAGLYARAHAAPAALETLYRQFLRDLSARLALAPDVNLEQMAEVAARHGGADKASLRRLLATCEQRLDSGAVTEAELLELTRQMEAVRKDIGIA